jgi:hypothetical protein
VEALDTVPVHEIMDVVHTLRRIDPGNAAIAPAVLRVLHDRRSWMRAGALRELRPTGPELTEALAPTVIASLRSGDEGLRSAGAWSSRSGSAVAPRGDPVEEVS